MGRLPENIKIRLPEKKNFLIIGSGDGVKAFIKKIGQYFPNSPVFIISEKECDSAWSICEKEPIESIARKKGFPLMFTNDINRKEIINKVKTRGCNICFVLGYRWILKKEFMDLFSGNTFNCHAADVCHYRGGGGYRWQLLHQERDIHISFHQITEKIDAGPILMVFKKELGKKQNIYPKDVFIEAHKFRLECFDTFFQRMAQQEEFFLTCQNQDMATYFPLLDNNENGAIDFNWSKKDIKLFIDAFSDPYKGVFAFYKNEKVFIKRAEISKRERAFHPFAAGLIINKTKNYLEIAVKDGSILFQEIRNKRNENLPTSYFRLGDRLYVPFDILLRSRIYRPCNRRFILNISRKD